MSYSHAQRQSEKPLLPGLTAAPRHTLQGETVTHGPTLAQPGAGWELQLGFRIWNRGGAAKPTSAVNMSARSLHISEPLCFFCPGSPVSLARGTAGRGDSEGGGGER